MGLRMIAILDSWSSFPAIPGVQGRADRTANSGGTARNTTCRRSSILRRRSTQDELRGASMAEGGQAGKRDCGPVGSGRARGGEPSVHGNASCIGSTAPAPRLRPLRLPVRQCPPRRQSAGMLSGKLAMVARTHQSPQRTCRGCCTLLRLMPSCHHWKTRNEQLVH